jgi:hypothetical protein
VHATFDKVVKEQLDSRYDALRESLMEDVQKMLPTDRSPLSPQLGGGDEAFDYYMSIEKPKALPIREVQEVSTSCRWRQRR